VRVFDLSGRRLLRAAGAFPITSGVLALFSGILPGRTKAQIDIGWRQLIALTVIGAAPFAYTLACFRSTIGTMA
jgi:hypothetical protein